MNIKKKSLQKFIMLTASACTLIFLDQFIKTLVLNNLKGQSPIVIFKDVLEFTFVGNKGIAWGMLWDKVNKVVVFTFIISAVVIAMIIRLEAINNYLKTNIPTIDKAEEEYTDTKKLIKKYSILQLLLTFLVAGAIGNLIDRIRLGYVVDFIYFKLIDFPVFNMADIYVTCTIAAMFIVFVFVLSEEDFSKIYTKISNWHKGDKNDSK